MLGSVILCLCGSWKIDTRFSITPLRQSRTVKRSVRVAPAIHIVPALIFQSFVHYLLCQLARYLTDGKVLADKLHIEHISIPITPAPVAGDSDRVCVCNLFPARLVTGEILCQREAVLFPVPSHITDIATAIVIRLYNDIYIIYALPFC